VSGANSSRYDHIVKANDATDAEVEGHDMRFKIVK
jgi:hypothetical protein